jgi:hypothetical protein
LNVSLNVSKVGGSGTQELFHLAFARVFFGGWFGSTSRRSSRIVVRCRCRCRRRGGRRIGTMMHRRSSGSYRRCRTSIRRWSWRRRRWWWSCCCC